MYVRAQDANSGLAADVYAPTKVTPDRFPAIQGALMGLLGDNVLVRVHHHEPGDERPDRMLILFGGFAENPEKTRLRKLGEQSVSVVCNLAGITGCTIVATNCIGEELCSMNAS